MEKLAQLFFLIVLAIGIGFFLFNLKRIRKNILKGRPVNRNDQKLLRWRQVLYLALGQNKMLSKPVSGILHIVVYLGFIIINLELFEIILDGLLGTHRLFAAFLGSSYAFLI